MLTELSIKNFAIIDDLSIQFSDGLTILSGETGAGKSIIINAVNLLLGSRATSKMIRTGADSAEIEALFHIPPAGIVAETLQGHGIEPSDGLLIRRVISSTDRHRVYINGRIATMQLLNEITKNLAAISGQHEHQQLLNETRHLQILDQFGNLMPLRDQTHNCYHDIVPLIHKLSDLKASRQKQHEHMALLEFEKKEIEDADISANEDNRLRQEQIRLKNAGMLNQIVRSSIQALYSGDGAITEKIGEIRRQIENAARTDKLLSASSEALTDVTFRIEDIVQQLRSYIEGINFDEGRLDEVESRLDLINRLKRKYGGSLESLFCHLDQINHEFSDFDNIDDKISDTEKQLDRKHKQLTAIVNKLSGKRKLCAARLSKKIEKELNALKMPKTRFEVAFTQTVAAPTTSPYLMVKDKIITEEGAEQACFMIAPNVGEALKPLSQIASGGELSRVILALKSIATDADANGTMIFDEVDAGIGGDVADVVGKRLSSLAAANQVICITHLAQIASFGRHHFKISKQIENHRTCTRITPLNDDERLEEIARMIGGEKITPATRNHALEMLKRGNKYLFKSTNFHDCQSGKSKDTIGN